MAGFLLVLVVLFYNTQQECSAQNPKDLQVAVLYAGKDGTGESVMIEQGIVPDLTARKFLKKALSVCLTGVWLMYENTDFNTGPTFGLVEYIHGPDLYCVNLVNLEGKMSSIKYAGWPKNGNANTFTLYAKDYFQGTQEYMQADKGALKLDKNSASLIITGAMAWTVYTEPSFKGVSTCIIAPKADKFIPAFVYDLKIINIAANSIRSVKLGCHGSKKITVP